MGSSIDKYRMDGSPYPPGHEGLMEWARDIEDTRGRIVRQETLWNGIWLSTVWLGIDHNFGVGPPLIFESMAFANRHPLPGSAPGELECVRYSTLPAAERGHAALKRELSGVGYTLRLWWDCIWREVKE